MGGFMSRTSRMPHPTASKRRKKSPDLVPSVPENTTVTLDRAAFQVLHSAARSVFRNQIQVDNHTKETLIYLQLLDKAIDVGHEALGTLRPYADQYIHLVTGLTQTQVQNARRILESEGLLPTENLPKIEE